MKKPIILTLIILYISIKSIFATHLDIRIFYNEAVKTAEIGIQAGNYHILSGIQPIKQVLRGEIINLVAIGDSIEVSQLNLKPKRYAQLEIKGLSFINNFTVKTTLKKNPKRTYDDDLYIKAANGKLILLNHIDIEHYVAGVVQSESGGSTDQIEFFFVQSIISRTYALVNYLKHKNEGFNLCDGVHCQVYNGRNRNADITRAVARTGGDVIVDKDKKMISAAFHSNCGGQTVNSEDVWTIPTSYLKSITDSFCNLNQTFTWETKIPLSRYNLFLSGHQQKPIQGNDSTANFIFRQPIRQAKGPGEIPLKDFRNYFGLRSTFFDIQKVGDEIIFIGRGYGHGVGLCQHGAINMIQLGYDYKEVIKYYYKDVEIIHYSELNYNYMP